MLETLILDHSLFITNKPTAYLKNT